MGGEMKFSMDEELDLHVGIMVHFVGVLDWKAVLANTEGLGAGGVDVVLGDRHEMRIVSAHNLLADVTRTSVLARITTNIAGGEYFGFIHT